MALILLYIFWFCTKIVNYFFLNYWYNAGVTQAGINQQNFLDIFIYYMYITVIYLVILPDLR